MLRRIAYIENRKTLADSGEYTTLLGVRDIITALYFEFRCTNGASGNKANTLAECVSAVELIDGGNVLWSMTGQELFGYSCATLGYMPYNLIDENGGSVQNFVGIFQFGRWLGDTIYALDPARFKNLQVRIKWNLAAVRAVAATSYATGTMQFSCFAEIIEGAQTPQAMLTQKTHYGFTTAASGIEQIDMPTDKRLKSLLVRSYLVTAGGLGGLSNLKLLADQGKFVPFDLAKSDFQRLISMKSKPYTYKHGLFAKDADVFYSVLKQDEVAVFARGEGDTVISYANTGIGSGALDVITGGVAAASELTLNGEVFGWSPYNTWVFPFGDWDDPSSWLDATSFDKLRLDLTNNAASAVASVVLEQEHIY